MGILQARILEWVVRSSSRESSQHRDRTQVSCITGGFFTVWPTREALKKAEYRRIDAFQLQCWRRLKSPLDYQEIKPVILKKKKKKKNQPWIFTGRTDAEAEAPILWPPDMKSHLLGKDPDAGKDWRQKQKGAAEDETVRQHHWLSGVWASSRRQRRTEGPGVLRSLGSQTVKHDSVTEQQQQNPQRAIIKRTPRFSCSVPKETPSFSFPFNRTKRSGLEEAAHC